MKDILVTLDAGEHLNRNPNEPVIHLVAGERPYLWIGNNVSCPRCGGDGGDRYLCGLCGGQGVVAKEVARKWRADERR